jgi:FAD/FMN-containing dehydrogenase
VQTPHGFRGAFRTDDAARALYAEGAGIYRILPAAVAVPTSTDDLVTLVRWAAATGTPLVPRGAGSGMPGHNVGPGVVVDLTQGFRDTPRVDPVARLARGGAAVTFSELNGVAAASGMRLPPDPSSGAFCTLGGMAACNASGAHTLKYGAMRDWTEAVEFVTADGEIGRAGRERLPPEAWTAAERRLETDAAPWLRAHQLALERAVPKTRKNSSGYAFVGQGDGAWVRHLLVGSEGTLVFITAVEVRLAPLPDEVSTLLVSLRALEDIAPAIERLRPFTPSACELLDRTYLDFVRAAAHAPIPAGTEAVLLVEFEHDAHAAADAVQGLASSTVCADDPAAIAQLWEVRHLASPTLAALPDTMRSLQVVEDGCVPPGRLSDYIRQLRALAAAHGFQVVIFGHAGDGHVHANLLADVTAPDVAARLAACLADVSAAQIELGGTLSGEHGDGRLRAPFAEALLGATAMEAARRVKAAFDPLGILNPGVKLPAGPAFTAGQLKFGPGAPPLPAGVAEALRSIEKSARWGTFRLDVAPPASA